MNDVPTVGKYQIVNGTYYSAETSKAVVDVLETCRKQSTIVRIVLGWTTTGLAWAEENDVIGRIGRSMGPIKVPLLVPPGEDGGGAISDDHIIGICRKPRVGNSTALNWLYRHPKLNFGKYHVYQLPEDADKVWRVSLDGGEVARFTNQQEAENYKLFMDGTAFSQPKQRRRT